MTPVLAKAPDVDSMSIPPPERRIAFAQQPEGHPVALYTQGVDRKATHDIPTDGAPSPCACVCLPLSSMLCWCPACFRFCLCLCFLRVRF